MRAGATVKDHWLNIYAINASGRIFLINGVT